MRNDLRAVSQWIAEGARVLDLGCGDGVLLAHLRNEKNTRGLGVEIDADNITRCIAWGIDVIEQDIDNGLGNFADDSFDTVVLTQTLQAVQKPDVVVREMLRVGKECVITFPNFGYWQARFHLLFAGKMPVSRFMPYSWYDTPNIHFCTIRDFEQFCLEQNIRVLNRAFYKESAASDEKRLRFASWMPNLLATHAVYHVSY